MEPDSRIRSLAYSPEASSLSVSRADSAIDSATPTRSGWWGGVHLESMANFAHELRTPVQVLLGYIDILRDEPADAMHHGDRAIIERMNANVHELAQTVENVLEFALASAAVQTAPEELIVLAEFIDELDEVLKASMVNRELVLRFDLQHAPATIVTKRRALRSIVLNLATNAIKFTESGEVAIIASRISGDPAMLLIEVRDTGMGISDDMLAFAFQPMAQLSQSPVRRYRGLGLGLAVVQRNVTALRGRIWVESIPGSGSCFKVAIPCADSAQHVCE